jgi:hypothetical protein
VDERAVDATAARVFDDGAAEQVHAGGAERCVRRADRAAVDPRQEPAPGVVGTTVDLVQLPQLIG